MGLMFSIAAAESSSPSTGLTLSDFSVDISAVRKSDLAVTAPVSNAAMTLEAGNGFYVYNNASLDSNVYYYFVSVEYTGVTSLDQTQWQVSCPQSQYLDTLIRGGQTDQSLESLRILIGNVDTATAKAADIVDQCESALASYGVVAQEYFDDAMETLRGTDAAASVSTVLSAVGTALNHLAKVRGVVCGNQKILNNQMIFYDEDNVEIYRFNLYNSDGYPAESSVYERRKV